MRFSIKRNIASLDTFKVLAIFMIIVLHTGYNNLAELEFWRWIYFLVERLARFAVPLFFMASGYFFSKKLAKEKSIKKVFLYYLGRISLLYVAWKLLYILIPNTWSAGSGFFSAIINNGAENIKSFISDPFFNLMVGKGFHLWFLIALLVALAYIVLAIKYGLEKWSLAIALAIYIFGLAITSYSPFLLAHDHVNPQILYGFLFSPMFVSLGFWLYGQKLDCPAWSITVLIILGYALQFIEAIFLYFRYTIPLYWSNFTLGTIIFSLGIFLLTLKYPDLGKNRYASKLGVYVLGIYLVHIFVRGAVFSLDFYNYTVLVILMPIIVFLISLSVVYSLFKVPLIKKLFI